MLDAEGGGVGATGGSDLERGVGALQRFQQRVIKLLGDLEEGAASKTKVAAQTVPRGSFSDSSVTFHEADGFYREYNRVHSELVSLSKSLGDQIEMLRIAVRGAEVGFDNLEEDLRRRFHSIQTRVLQEQQEKHDKAPGDKSGVSEPPRDERKKIRSKDLG
ncbi:hypothetical protein [Streptomyces sp. NBC_01481]|uniref:hypothetical protein n=1 Tax=Streptomyces sp. NBC_01481 TaxID=2975869 RepID=UPI00225B521D|nr:hypothetical protein [Streptomyces sp. NBC_01481]MCX4587785.1 hypothetical protein [Streptomyces sp. NBC_01481]